MARSSLTDRLVDLRRGYTGENLSQAVPAVRAALHADDVRRRVAAALDGVGTARGLVLPDAEDDAQRALECVVFQAGTDAGAHLQLRPPASMLRPAHAFRAAEPGPLSRLHLTGYALGPLLFELLPREEDGWLAGVPGLRTRQHPRSLELVLLDTEASVVFAGVDARRFAEGMDYVRTLMTGRGLTGVFVDGPLSAAERDHLAEFPRPTGLGSALLRRPHLFADTPWVRSWSQGDTWWVEWPESVGVTGVVDRLLDPVFGFANVREVPGVAGGLGLSDGWRELFLRVVDGPDPAHEEALAAADWPEGVTGWGRTT
ncbi:hypothetical protein [Saccharothrix violaceirubra]|uniref:Uncharacterized protein n=1 Tax=Saccharothrix violaceirubra TaxID=413306 RepID=A0A7W7WUN6_9PSEU|nr:hypothetical protein [Saccharothrix violaceirubra]MBB4964291.1 hypothetical protein [Saccharothrix violaceirubra]